MTSDFWIYKPHDRWEAPVDLVRCRYSVTGFGVRLKQCERKGVVEIGDYKFCKQHGKRYAPPPATGAA